MDLIILKKVHRACLRELSNQMIDKTFDLFFLHSHPQSNHAHPQLENIEVTSDMHQVKTLYLTGR